MGSNPRSALPAPRRGEILDRLPCGGHRAALLVLIVSLDARNLSENALTVLAIPFASRIVESPTTLVLPPGETNLPGPSCLRAHFITTLPKAQLAQRLPRPFKRASDA